MNYDDFEGCWKYDIPEDKKCFEANDDKIIETAKDRGMSVADVVALISIH